MSNFSKRAIEKVRSTIFAVEEMGIDQGKENVKIVRTRQISRDVNSKQQTGKTRSDKTHCKFLGGQCSMDEDPKKHDYKRRKTKYGCKNECKPGTEWYLTSRKSMKLWN